MKTRIILMLLFVLLLTIPKAFSQNIGINASGTTPDSSAMLDVSSTTKGFLTPRMTTTQQNAIPLPGKGLLVYNSTNNAFMVNTGTSVAPVWTSLLNGGGAITSVNGLIAVAQTLVVGTSGTDVNISSTGSTHTFNFPDASATARGLVTTGTQTFNGNKTFSGTIDAGSLASGASTDSIVTVDATGVLKKRTIANVVSNNNIWSVTGNSGISSAVNFLGTTNNASLRLRTNNVQRMVIDSFVGNVGIGTDVFDATNPEKLLVDAGTTNSVNAMYLKGNINNYLQLNLRNNSSGTKASSDLVVTADNGSETTNFMDVGINGSGYTYQAGDLIGSGKANDGYLISSANDMYIANNNPTKAMVFLTGGTATANERMRILANGMVGIGATVPTSTLQISGSLALSITNQNLNYVATATDYSIVCNNTTGAITIALPTAVGSAGRLYVIKKVSAELNDVIIQPVLLQTIDGAMLKTLSIQYDKATIQSNGSNWIVL